MLGLVLPTDATGRRLRWASPEGAHAVESFAAGSGHESATGRLRTRARGSGQAGVPPPLHGRGAGLRPRGGAAGQGSPSSPAPAP